MSSVTAVSAAPPTDAERHFAARLALETDAAGVGAAVTGGAPDFVLVDVRSAAAFAEEHVPGAVSLPHARSDDAAARAARRARRRPCWSPAATPPSTGRCASPAHGRAVGEMLGGRESYVREGRPVEGGPRRRRRYARDASGLAGLPADAGGVSALTSGTPVRHVGA